jgi:hypothetical protein
VLINNQKPNKKRREEIAKIKLQDSVTAAEGYPVPSEKILNLRLMPLLHVSLYRAI